VDVAPGGIDFLLTQSKAKQLAMVKAMEKIRSFLVRGLAIITVVLTYALGTVGTQVLSVAGISAAGVTATATPANAWRRFRHRRFFLHRRFFRRRRFHRRWW